MEYIYEVQTRPESEWVKPAIEKERERIWHQVMTMMPEQMKGDVPMIALQDVKGAIFNESK